MTPVTIYVAARCEKAGRKTNQDSILVSPDLSLPQVAMTSSFELDKSVTLDRWGSLPLVADGMGGMNAGERASQLVVEGVRQAFADTPDDAVASQLRQVTLSPRLWPLPTRRSSSGPPPTVTRKVWEVPSLLSGCLVTK